MTKVSYQINPPTIYVIKQRKLGENYFKTETKTSKYIYTINLHIDKATVSLPPFVLVEASII